MTIEFWRSDQKATPFRLRSHWLSSSLTRWLLKPGFFITEFLPSCFFLVVGSARQCTESKELFEWATAAGQTPLDSAALRDLCPLVLYQLQAGLCHAGAADAADADAADAGGSGPAVKPADAKQKPTPAEGTFLLCKTRYN